MRETRSSLSSEHGPRPSRLCPIIWRLRCRGRSCSATCLRDCATPGAAGPGARAFDVRPDFDLHVMTPGQSLFQTTSRIITGLQPRSRRGGTGYGRGAGRHHDDVLRRSGRFLLRDTGCPCRSRIADRRILPALPRGDEPAPDHAVSPDCTWPPPEWAADNLRREGIPEEQYRGYRQHGHRRGACM